MQGVRKGNIPGILAPGSQFLRRLLLLLVACALEVQGLTGQNGPSVNLLPPNSKRNHHRRSEKQRLVPASPHRLLAAAAAPDSLALVLHTSSRLFLEILLKTGITFFRKIYHNLLKLKMFMYSDLAFSLLYILQELR